MMNLLLFVVTNLSSLIFLCFREYSNQKKKNGKTRSFKVLDVDNPTNIIQASQPQKMRSTSMHAQENTPKIGSFDVPHYHESRHGIQPPPIEVDAYEIKASLIRLIQGSKFMGLAMENPYDHFESFERLCSTFRIGCVPENSIKLILFLFFFLEKKQANWRELYHLIWSILGMIVKRSSFSCSTSRKNGQSEK